MFGATKPTPMGNRPDDSLPIPKASAILGGIPSRDMLKQSGVLGKAWIAVQRWLDAWWGYDVFIAHRRADAAEYASALHRQLGVEKISSFIDRVAYGPGDSLLIATERHVTKSTIFLLVGSPELLKPRKPVDWIEKEIQTFLNAHQSDPKVILVDFGNVVADELARYGPTEAPDNQILKQLAPYLRLSEPLGALALPPSGDVLAAVRQKLDGRRRDRTRLWFFEAASAVLTLLLILATVLGIAAELARQLAKQTTRVATTTANELVFNIVDRFRDRQGIPTDLVLSVLQQADSATEKLLRLDVGGAEVTRSAAAALAEISVVFRRQGRGAESVKAARQAVVLFEQLAALDRHSFERAVDLATAYDRLGEAQLIAGESAGAREAFTRSYDIATTLLIEGGDDGRLKRIAALGLEKSGELSLVNNPNDALKKFMRSARLREELLRQTNDPEVKRELAISHERIGDALFKLKQGDERHEALHEYELSLGLTRELFESDHGRTDFSNDYAMINQKLGRVVAELVDARAALEYFRAAASISSQLAEDNVSRNDLQLEAVRSKVAFAEVLSKCHQTGPALQQLRETVSILSRAAQTSVEWYRAAYDAYLLLGQLLKSAEAPDSALGAFESAGVNTRRIIAMQGKSSDFALKLVYLAAEEAEVLIDLGKPVEGKETNQYIVAEIRGLVAADKATQAALVQALGNLAWYAIIGHAALEAIAAADEAVTIDSQAHWVRINKAHALLVLGLRRQALDQYRAAVLHPRSDGKKWVEVITKDFAVLSRAGVIFEPMSDTEASELAKIELESRDEK
jgi:tetratricopeptide (TPR) repeat protein